MRPKGFSKPLAFLLLFGLSQYKANDSTLSKPRKNVIRVNIINPLLFGETSYVLGYERVLNKHQSMSINVGRVSFDKFLFSGFTGVNNTHLTINNSYNDEGIHTSLDYRFYLKKENKFNAPRGVYIGPYVSYNYFKRVNSWSIVSNAFTGEFTTTLKMNMATVGGELGYQFVLWRRLAIDFILLGPGLTNYRFSSQFSTNLDPSEQYEVLQKLYDKLEAGLIGLGWVMDGDEFVKSGSTNTTSMGFRYMIHIGFCF